MKRFLIALKLLALVGCQSITVYDEVDMPVALVFPSEEMRDEVENTFVDRIDDANDIFKNSGVTVVIDTVKVADYDAIDVEDWKALKTPVGGPLPLYVTDTLIDEDGEAYGAYAVYHNCQKAILFHESSLFPDNGLPTSAPWVVAHEVAHQLGLEHVEDEGNFMRPNRYGGGTDITLEQEQDLLFGANEYRQTCMGLDR